MRALIVVLCLSLCSQNGFAENPAETFSLSNYKLAYAEVNKTGHSVNEYVRRGETLDNWTSLIAVRKWPNETNLETVIGYYMQNIKDFKVEEPTPLSVKGKSKNNEQIFEVFLAPPKKSHLEYSVVRFVRDQADRSIKSYQLSYRGAYDLAKLRQFSASGLQARIGTISSFSLPVYSTTNVEQFVSESQETVTYESTSESSTDESYDADDDDMDDDTGEDDSDDMDDDSDDDDSDEEDSDEEDSDEGDSDQDDSGDDE